MGNKCWGVYMSTENLFQRRDVIVGLAGLVATAATTTAHAQSADPSSHANHVKNDALPPASLTPVAMALISSTTDCIAAGRVCLARCTDHLAAGVSDMADCQRAVMNMLAVVTAMADVAAYSNSAPADARSLAAACAQFCDTCAEQCRPHANHHEECKACLDACLECAKACKAFVA